MSWFIAGNVPSSKNGRRWTGKYFIASKTVMKYRKLTKDIYEKHKQSFLDATKDLQKPIKVKFTFYRGTKHKFDYINPAQTVQDDMVEYGWISDDNADEIIPVFVEYIYDKNNPGVLIELSDDNSRI